MGGVLIPWLVFAGVAIAAGVVSGKLSYLLTTRFRKGTGLTVLLGIVGGVLGSSAFLLSAPADHGEHSSIASFVVLWPTVTGTLIGRGEARKRLIAEGKVAVEDLD